MNTAIRVVLILLILSVPAAAQRRKATGSDYAPGDKVEVKMGRDPSPGEVVKVNQNGWVTVRVTRSGRQMEMTLPPSRIQKVAGGTPATPPAKPTGNPFAPPAKASPLAGMRTWTDSTGQYKTEAEFVEFKDGNVHLKKTDGTPVAIPLDRLSAADQQLVRSGTQQSTVAKQPVAAGVGDGGLVAADWSAAKNVMLSAPQVWSLAANPPTEPTQPLAQTPIALAPPAGGKGFFEIVSCLGFDRMRGYAFLSRINSPPGGSKAVWLERCDLTTGRSLGTAEMPTDIRLLDVDASGQRMLTRSEAFGFGKKARLDLWDVSGSMPQRLISWEPYGSAQGGKKDVSFAAFIDASHAITVGGGKLALWALPEARALYTLKVNSTPAINEGGKYLAVSTEEGMFVLDAMTGATLGRLAGDTGAFMKFSFRPDGLRLAMHCHGGRLQVWDCEKGERIREIFLHGIHSADQMDWVSDDHIVLGRSSLLDVTRRVILWRYEGMKGAGGGCGGHFWCALPRGSEQKGLSPFKIPHDEAVRAAAGMSADQLLVLKPGSAVRLKVNVPVAPGQAPKITETLTARLQENGVSIASNAPLVLEAISDKGKTKSITYRGFGFRGGQNTVQVTEQVYKLIVKENDTVIWQSVRVNAAPPMLHLQEGQTIEQALAEYTKPDIAFFLNTPIPRMLARPGKHNGAYGVSKLTAQGMQTVSRP